MGVNDYANGKALHTSKKSTVCNTTANPEDHQSFESLTLAPLFRGAAHFVGLEDPHEMSPTPGRAAPGPSLGAPFPEVSPQQLAYYHPHLLLQLGLLGAAGRGRRHEGNRSPDEGAGCRGRSLESNCILNTMGSA